MIDILRNPRFIAANTIIGLSLAANAGCAINEPSPEERIDASYDQEFINDPKTSCYGANLDHDSIEADLRDELDQRVWLDAASLEDTDIENAAEDIATILTAIPELGNVTASSFKEMGSTYEVCLNGDEIQAGDPYNFVAAVAYTPSSK